MLTESFLYMQITQRSVSISSLTVGRGCPKYVSMELTSRRRNRLAGIHSTV